MRLILHAGTHKTGTTSIQKVLADNRGWLLERGLHYPDGAAAFGKTRVPHHKFAHAVVGDDAGELVRAARFVEADCRPPAAAEAVLISAEPIYRHVDGRRDWNFTCPDYWARRQRYLDRLAALLRGFDVTVMLFFREQAAFARSLRAEVMAKRVWVGDEDAFARDFAPWFDYERQAGLFRASFKDVRTQSYEAALKRGLVPAFFDAIGFPAPPGSETVWERRTQYPVAPVPAHRLPRRRRAFAAPQVRAAAAT